MCVMYRGLRHLVSFSGLESIHYVKDSLAISLGIASERQVLSYEGEILDDGKLPPHSGFESILT